MAPTIHSLVPAVRRWHALYRGEYEEDAESARVVADAASAIAPQFDRYGFRRE